MGIELITMHALKSLTTLCLQTLRRPEGRDLDMRLGLKGRYRRKEESLLQEQPDLRGWKDLLESKSQVSTLATVSGRATNGIEVTSDALPC